LGGTISVIPANKLPLQQSN